MILRLVFIIFFLFQCSEEHSHKDIYYCPMHPQITSNKPGTCPICHMKLVKKEKSQEKKSTEHKEEKENLVKIPKEKQVWIGVQTAKVETRKITKTLRFAGSVAYEPELFTALSEYVESLKHRGNSELAHNVDLSGIAYNRLLQLGLTKEGIRFLTSRNLSELITGGRNSAIIIARIYEGELGNIQTNSNVKVYSTAYPNLTFNGKIQAIDGILDQETRTLRAWILVNNIQNSLKPQMLVEIEISVESKNALTIPSSAIIHIGKRNIVYKKISETEFISQEILVGIESENFTEVASGLSENEEVVTHGVFLIDSESKIHFSSSEE